MADPRSKENDLARILVQSSIDGLFATDREGRYTLWNSAMEAFAGKTAAEVLGRGVFDIFPFLRDLGLDQAMQRALAGNSVILEAVPNVLPNGATHYFDRHYLPLRNDAGKVVGMVGVVRDTTARRDAEDALRSSEAKLRTAVEASGIGLWSWDTERDEVMWEGPLGALFGLPPEATPSTREGYLALVHPDDRDRVRETSELGATRGGWESEHRIVRPDGGVRWVLSKTTVVRRDGHDLALGALIDISDRRQRDEQARKAQKLEAVGQLTAGIAHNFNNILMALLPNLELAARAAPAEVAPLLASAELAASRAAELVRQLLTFAGRNRPTTRSVESIANLVERTVAFCGTTFDRRISVEGTYDASARAKVDPAQIEQAVANLVINARDALSDATVDDPRLAIRVDVVRHGALELDGRIGNFVCLRVRDNGVGMDAVTVAHVFEPFFTTKEVGKGTGLGLATTHAIVREHGGFITCDSAPHRGTTFSVYFPHTTAKEEAAPKAARPVLTRGTETILLVDDEAAIRKVVRHILEGTGYTALEAGTGAEALTLLSDARVASDVALVLLDVSMPGTNGRELQRRVRGLARRARIVLFTGYAMDVVRPA
jgi:two-component system cell cycle sensor histidine kinase/response regulator CckA